MELPPDTLLYNRYRIIRPLGQGGMGSVYLAYDTSLEVQVAVKSNRSTSAQSTEQFLREAHLLASLRHPNLPRVIDYFVVSTGQYLVMDYIPGDDLGVRLEKEGAQPLNRVLEWAGQLGSALSFLHSQVPPVVHRDIKPANLKLTAEGEVTLVDFGIAKSSDASQATATGATGYTPGFAPPEQYGRAGTGPYTDQYAFAATLYMMLTGKKPVESVQRVLGQAVLSPLNLLVPGIPQNVQAAIEKGMALKPDDRFRSINEMMAAMGDPRFTHTERRDAIREVVGTATSGATVRGKTVQKVEAVMEQPARKKGFPVIGFVVIGLVVLAFAAVAVLGLGILFVNRGKNLVSQTTAPTAAQVSLVDTQPADTPIPESTDTPVPSTEGPTNVAASTNTSVPAATAVPTYTPGPRPLGEDRLIAFVSDRADGKTLQIWTMKAGLDNTGNISASEYTQVTFDDGDKGEPAWSPDGTSLLYTAAGSASNGKDVYLIDITNKDAKPIDMTNLKGDDTDPAWSPDGKMIAFVNTGRFVAGISSIYVQNVDGSGRLRISEDYQEFQPFWMPDLSWLMTVIYAKDHHYLFRHEGKSLGTATPSPYDPTTFFGRLGEVADAAISPDGKTLAYTRVKGKERSIFSVDYISRGDRISPLTDGKTQEYQPHWGPDGQYIVFTSERDGNREVYIMTSTGLLQTNLSNSSGVDWQAVWQPLEK
jgi:eukaryotic-like serine/threonine-protein kinase